MSDLISLIQITPDPLNWDNAPEVIQVVKKCPSCKGAGNFKTAKGYHGSAAGEFIINACQRCKGVGELRADIIIRWTPNETITE